MSDLLKQKPKIQVLMESFDKKYIEELFREGEKLVLGDGKVGLWKPDERQNYQYEYNGFLYTLSRTHMSVVMGLYRKRELEAKMQREAMGRKVV
jgi:hypothetical protein